MEEIKQQIENQENVHSNSNNEFTTTKAANRKPLRDWGHEQAGLNRGDSAALESHLRWIREGHIVDETYNESEEMFRKRQIDAEIIAKEKDKSDRDKDQQ